jgi:hypothetical protein
MIGLMKSRSNKSTEEVKNQEKATDQPAISVPGEQEYQNEPLKKVHTNEFAEKGEREEEDEEFSVHDTDVWCMDDSIECVLGAI